jgi:hypothetical protein
MSHSDNRPNRDLSCYLGLAVRLRQAEQVLRERERLLDLLLGLLKGVAYRAYAKRLTSSPV